MPEKHDRTVINDPKIGPDEKMSKIIKSPYDKFLYLIVFSDDIIVTTRLNYLSPNKEGFSLN